MLIIILPNRRRTIVKQSLCTRYFILDSGWNHFWSILPKVNFEGYRIYRSTESNFLEDKTITDVTRACFPLPIASLTCRRIKRLHPITIMALLLTWNDFGCSILLLILLLPNGEVYYMPSALMIRVLFSKILKGKLLVYLPLNARVSLKLMLTEMLKQMSILPVVNPMLQALAILILRLTVLRSGPATELLRNYYWRGFSQTIWHYRLNFWIIQHSIMILTSYRLINYSNNDTLIKFTPFGNNVQTLVMDGLKCISD